MTTPHANDNARGGIVPRGLRRVDAAAYICISPSLFDEMVRDGRMPGPRMINSRTVWDRFELDEAFDALPRKEAANPWDAYVPRPNPPRLTKDTDRHGNIGWYVRTLEGPKVRLRDEYGTPAFWQAYRDAMPGNIKRRKPSTRIERKPFDKESLAWLCSKYLHLG